MKICRNAIPSVDPVTIAAQLGFGLQCSRRERIDLAWRIKGIVEADLRGRIPSGRWTNRDINDSMCAALAGMAERIADLERELADRSPAR